jgi:hypothetical protein
VTKLDRELKERPELGITDLGNSETDLHQIWHISLFRRCDSHPQILWDF